MPDFKVSDANQLTLPVRRAIESLRRYIDIRSFPRKTTVQRDEVAASPGDTVYNTDANKHQGFNGTTWNDLY
jgi:hypothetical protein